MDIKEINEPNKARLLRYGLQCEKRFVDFKLIFYVIT